MQRTQDPFRANGLLAYQLLLVRHPRDVVEELVVADGVRLEQLLRELVRSPSHQDVP